MRAGSGDDGGTGTSATGRVGTLTFLMTDVEASSRLWEDDPDGASAALPRRHEIISEATLVHGGTMPVEQGEGDSSVSVFARAADAAACAIDLQRRLAGEPWPSNAKLRVRIAIHTGDAQLYRDGTYHGVALNRCARLRSIAHGGQILVSQATFALLVDGMPDAVRLRDLGVHRLRDLARPEQVWQLCHPDLPDGFPPLRSMDAAASNLPVPLTSFVGRDTEIETLSELLADHRLVTLTGAGGCGKTRLALQVAADIGERYPDGTRWVDLAALADPSLVPAALAAVLGLSDPPEPIADTVVRHLATRRTLVVIDNCEHLIDACAALVSRVVRDCASVTVVATSRELLGVEGEITWPVPPMSLPEGDEPANSESVRLFVDRARASRPTFALTDENVSTVAEICRRLDGIPLALELAAARTRVLHVDQIAEGLADRFHLLTGSARSALPRQRTLEGSVDWSHELLDDRERVVFRRLAALAGSFTLDAAETVCASDEIARADVLDLLGALVDRSLVQVVGEAGPHTRYRMLETIRDYARRKLSDAGDADAARDRHLDWCASFARRAEAGLEGADQLAWLARVDAELDNVRAALDWSVRSTDPDRGLRIVGRLVLYWFARGALGIGRARLEATLDHGGDDRDRADALGALCLVAYLGGDMAAAASYGDEALIIGRRLDDARTLGRALHCRAWVRFWGEADRVGAWADFEEADGLLRQSGDDVFRGLNLAMLGWSYVDSSNAPRAPALLEEALTLLPGAGAGRARTLFALGWLDHMQGRAEEAARSFDEVLALAREVGDHYIEVFTHTMLAMQEAERGLVPEGRDRCERALATALEHRSPSGEAAARWAIGMVELRAGRLDLAASEMEAAYQRTPMRWFAGICRATQAQLALVRSDREGARRYADDALTLGRASDSNAATAMALGVHGQLARLDGDPHMAEDLLHEALTVCHAAGTSPAVCQLLDDLAGVLADQRRWEEAVRLLAASRRARPAALRSRTTRLDGDAVGVAEDGLGDDVADNSSAWGFGRNVASHGGCLQAVAEAMSTEALDAAWAEGWALTLDDAVAYARRGRGQRKRPTQGWRSLTPTELQVVELVASGLTNPQIGRRMFISPRTVQSHLAHVFAKLDVSTRAELAACAALTGLRSSSVESYARRRTTGTT